jgi:WD40 repeat protein
VWDAHSGQCLLTCSGHEDEVWACGWSPDGQKLLSGSSDGTLKVWDAQTGECLSTHRDLPDGAWASVLGHDRAPLAVSADAWPHLGWQVKVPGEFPQLLHAEAYGPLPTN